MTSENNEKEQDGKALAFQALEQYKAQLALIESCIRAGRYNWALDTLHELHVHGRALRACLQDLPTDAATAALVASLPPQDAAPVVVATPIAEGSDKPATVVAEAPAKKVWTPPTPEQVQRALDKMFGHLPECTDEGDIVVVSFNGHLLDLPKAQRLVEPLKWFIKRGHILLFQETNRDALKFLSNETGYGLNVSHRNKRGQAVGILFHPRIKWLGQPYYHDYLTDIPGHPEWKTTLRPALQRKVRDVSTGLEFSVIDMHTKSNLGGPEETAPIRRLQFEMLVGDIVRQEGEGTVFGPTILGGDMNAAIDSPETKEIEPLMAAGFVLVPNPDGRSTYFYKGKANGQFDGFFARGFAENQLAPVWIPLPLEGKGERWFYSELSDHMPAFTRIVV